MSIPVTQTRNGRASVGMILCLAVVCAVGCATSWTPKTARPQAVMQWPYLPGAAKVIYDHALTGLARDASVGTVLESVVFGKMENRDSFVLPVAVATAGDGRIAVADMGRGCVHLYIPSAARYVCLSGSEREPLAAPVGVIFDEDSRLYVTDSAGRVFAFDAEGKVRFVLTKAGPQPLQRPTGIAYSPTRKAIYVVDTLAHTVDVFGTDGAFMFSFGERGAGAAQFNFPTHVTRAASGELYVTDALNFRVSIFDESGQALGSFGHHGDGSGDLAMPKGIAVDRDGVVYVVDALLDNVQAAVLDVKLRHLPAWIRHRRRIAELYRDGLVKIDGLSLPHFDETSHFDSFQNYVVRTAERDRLRAYLTEQGVETLVHWPRPMWAHEGLGLEVGPLPETERVCRQVLSLPMSAETTDEHVAITVEAIREFFS